MKRTFLMSVFYILEFTLFAQNNDVNWPVLKHYD